jgi:hypothetical protein
MFKVILSLLIAIILSGKGFCGEAIYAKETNSFFYKNGNIIKSEGQFENSYLLKSNKIIRTRVYNIKSQEIIADNTIYTIHKGLASDPNVNLASKNPIIRALGQPGSDAIEILVIDINGSQMQSIKSTADYFVISHYNIIQ